MDAILDKIQLESIDGGAMTHLSTAERALAMARVNGQFMTLFLDYVQCFGAGWQLAATCDPMLSVALMRWAGGFLHNEKLPQLIAKFKEERSALSHLHQPRPAGIFFAQQDCIPARLGMKAIDLSAKRTT